ACIRVRVERECFLDEGDRGGCVVSCRGLARGRDPRLKRPLTLPGCLLTERIAQLERSTEMVCDQFGTVVAIAGKLLHPGGGTFVSCGALRTCELCVGDVADQVVREPQLDLTRDAGLTRASQQLLALEPEGKLLGSGTVTLAERANRAQPARAPDHSCVLQDTLLISRECVQARGDDPLHRLGQSRPVRAS